MIFGSRSNHVDFHGRDATHRGRRHIRRSVKHIALTLVEMLMALAITGLIGAAIAAMLSAVAYGTSRDRDIRTLVVKNKTLGTRITAAVRQSAQLLDADDGYAVLWTRDLNGNGAPDLLELQRIELDRTTNELTSYTPDPAAADDSYDPDTDDLDAITTALIADGDLIGELWATGVTAWTVTLDAADPLDAALVSFQLTLTAGGLSDTSVNAVSLRD